MSTGKELDVSLQELADAQRLVAVDNISLGRVVLTFEDGSEVIVNSKDEEFLSCTFRMIQDKHFKATTAQAVVVNRKMH